MTARRIVLLVVSVAVLAGCTTTRNAATNCCADYQRPSFELSFFPETLDPIVEVSEDSNGVSIRVNWSGNRHPIVDTLGYQRIKKAILASKLWNEQASESFSQGPWCGSPRDILTIRSGNKGINLQGSDVPRAWKRNILGMANTYTFHPPLSSPERCPAGTSRSHKVSAK